MPDLSELAKQLNIQTTRGEPSWPCEICGKPLHVKYKDFSISTPYPTRADKRVICGYCTWARKDKI